MRNLSGGITARSLIVGLALAAAAGAVGPYLELYVQGSNASAYFTSPVAHILVFVLITVANGILGTINRAWIFDRSELIVIFILMSLGNAAPRILAYWVPLVSGPVYHATAENNWLALLIPHIPSWLIPHDPGAVAAFYEGTLADTEPIPWQVWVEPVLGWAPVLLGLYAATISLMVMLRRQWVEGERLIYPVMQLNLAMLQEDQKGRLGPFFRSGAMWIGFGLSVVVGSIIGLHAYFPFVPTVDMFIPFPLLKARVSFATIGFFFLIKREVAFGLWAFTLLNMLQANLYSAIGWGTERDPVITGWSYASHSLVHQAMGAQVVLVLGILWVSREHLARVFRKALTGVADTADDDEIMSYRAAVIGLILGIGAMLFWLLRVGVPLWGAVVFLFFAFVIYISLTRAVAEGGVAVIYTPLVAPDATISAIGTEALGAKGLIGMAFVRNFSNSQLNFAMPHVANGLKLSAQIPGSRRWLFWGMMAAMVLGLAGAFWALATLCYRYGAINLRPPNFIWLPNYVFDYTVSRITAPTGPNLIGWIHTGIGAAVMALLLLARRMFTWWPLHPVGFPISATFDWMAFNAFVAWALKGPILRYGGVRAYRSVRPFFLGMIMGQFFIYGVFWIIDSVTGMVGNRLFL